MKHIAVYPGSFDPATLGHLGILKRATKLFDEVHVLVVHNPSKKPMFSSAERLNMIKQSVRELGIDISPLRFSTLESGLLAEYADIHGAHALIKGFRTVGDIEYELPMSQVNNDLSGVETIFMASEPGLGYVSSSLVKEVSSLGGDISKYVTKAVAEKMREKLDAD